MSEQIKRDDMRKWAMLGGLGLGLAMLGRRRKWRRFMYGQAGGHHFGGYGPAGRFGGYGPWAPGGPQQGFQLPPFIEATFEGLARSAARHGSAADKRNHRAVRPRPGLNTSPPDRGGA